MAIEDGAPAAVVEPPAAASGEHTTISPPTDETTVDPADIPTNEEHIPTPPSADTASDPVDLAGTVPLTSDETERTRTSETVTTETQRQEVSILAANSLYRRIHAVQNEVNDFKDQQLVDFLNTTSAEKNAQYVLGAIESGDIRIPLSFSTDENPLEMVMADGEKVKIKTLEAGSGDMIYCTIVHTEGEQKNVAFDRRELAQAYLQNEKGNITDSMSPTEVKVIDLYLEQLSENPDAEILAQPGDAAVNNLIQEGAREAGIPTIDDVNDLAKRVNLSEADKAAILELTKGNILSPKSFKEAMKKTNLAPEKIKMEIRKLEAAIAHAEQNPKRTPTEEAKLQEMKDNLQLYTQFNDMYTDGGPLDQVFAQIKNGEIDTTVAQELMEGFRSGKIDTDAFEKFGDAFPALKRQPGESHAEWQARVTKKVGMAGLIALILIMTVAQAVPSVGPQEGGR